MIDKSTVKRILDAADIVEVVGDYVHLVKRGSNYMGLCPFHNEKTASFSVNRPRNICHCFSCGKGGSPVNFIMEKEGINYHDALLHLANKYGIKVEERELTDEERERQSERESMLIINEWAMQEMEKNLHQTAEGQEVALQYFRHRGLTDNAIKKFRLGYAIDKSHNLYDNAIKLGYDIKYLKAVGLCGESQQGNIYDRFRGRVIFPIFNSAGKVIAFGGRGIKGEVAKYINSPESSVYRKSNELYGIYQAKNAIVRQDKCYLVEGYMDVIGMWQSGMENVVASSGTSLTDGQIALIHRFTKNITLIYDGDSAGIKASLRGIDLLLMHNMNVKVLLLPDGEDPDSFSRQHSSEEFKKYVNENETDFIKFKTQILLDNSKNDAHSRTEAVKSIVKSLASISDNIRRAFYIQECSRLLKISERLLIIEVGKNREEVVNEQKRQRERAKIEIEKADDVVNISVSESENEELQRLKETEKKSSLYPLEKEIVRYCLKYGMMNFCSALDGDNGTKDLKVIEYVAEEMAMDEISFSVKVFSEIFNKIKSLLPEFKEAEEDYRKKLEIELNEKIEQGYVKIAQKHNTIQEIEIAEKELNQDIEEQRNKKIAEFTQLYVGKELGSDIDDLVRKISLDLLTEKYQLSKYHSKSARIETESEKIRELLPRAISEWKDGILKERFKQVQNELKLSAMQGDNTKVEELMQELQQISEMRCVFAKYIGERIISPKN